LTGIRKQFLGVSKHLKGRCALWCVGRKRKPLGRRKVKSFNKELIRVHYFHLFWKSLLYLCAINVIMFAPELGVGDDDARALVFDTTVNCAFFIVAVAAPFVQLALCYLYISHKVNTPDIMTLVTQGARLPFLVELYNTAVAFASFLLFSWRQQPRYCASSARRQIRREAPHQARRGDRSQKGPRLPRDRS